MPDGGSWDIFFYPTLTLMIDSSITQSSIYGVIVYFCYVMHHWTIDQAIFSTIDFTMAWFPASLLKTLRCLSTWATTMHVRFVYERGRYSTMVKMRHGLATLNSNYSVVYGQKHKVWVLVFLVRTSATSWYPKLSRFCEIFCFATKPHHLQQLHARNAA